MSEISDEELKKLFKELKALDEVPPDVATRMDATIDRLSAAEKKKKSSRLATTSWALAASVTLVFGLGVVLNLDSSPVNQSPSTSSSESPQKSDEDVLTSTEDEPVVTSEPVAQYASNIDYSATISLADLPFNTTVNYGSLAKLPSELLSCLTSLGFEDSVSFIDVARYGDKEVMAVWSAVTGKSWQISIIDSDCEGIDKVFVNE
jgi:hypothetical protein